MKKDYSEAHSASFELVADKKRSLPDLKKIKELTSQLLVYDKKTAWPPRVVSKHSKIIFPIDPINKTPEFADFDRITRQTIKMLKKRDMLGDNCAHMITQHITQTNHKQIDGERLFEYRMLFYDYTKNQAIEVLFKNQHQITINHLDDIHIPETYHEIQTAIRLARQDHKLAKLVEGLDSDAMLEPISDSSHPSYKNRVMRVMFTEKYDRHKELPVLYCALVDLNQKKVLEAGTSPCI